MGGFAGGAAPAAAPAEEPEEAAPKVEEKTLFNVKLDSIEAGSKPKIIKKFVESAPKMMKEGVPKEEAEKMIELMKSLGAVAKME
jgi:large subunit ribosomal protein L7/L12